VLSIQWLFRDREEAVTKCLLVNFASPSDISVFGGVIGDEEIADFVAGIYAPSERA
jgi:hypothetical protein